MNVDEDLVDLSLLTMQQQRLFVVAAAAAVVAVAVVPVVGQVCRYELFA